MTRARMQAGVLALLSCVLAAPGRAAPPGGGTGARAADPDQPMCLSGATAYVTPERAVKNATLVLRRGRVEAVGAGVPCPADARVSDVSGKIITAGLVEASTSLGLIEIDQVAEANDGQFTSKTDGEVHAAFRVVDSFDRLSMAIPVARAGGVTSAVAAPSGSLIAGQAALVSLVPPHPGAGAAQTSPFVRAPAAMIATLGSHSVKGSPSRGTTIEHLREVLDDARQYRRNRARFERNQSRAFAAGRLDLEALQPVIEGRLPLVVHAHRVSDIRAVMRMKKELGISVILQGATEAWLVAGELARARIPVIVDPMDNLPYDFDRMRVRPDNAARLAQAGCVVAISTLGSAAGVRRLRQLAGNAVAMGLPWQAALDAITRAPARIFGATDLGTLEPGARADLVLWSGDPLELSTRVLVVVIGGHLIPPESHQTELLRRYRHLPSRR